MKTFFASVDPAFPAVSGADLRTWQNASVASEIGPVVLASIGVPQARAAPAGIQIEHIPGMETSDVWRADFDVPFPAATVTNFRVLCGQFRPDTIVLSSLPLGNLIGVAKSCARTVVLDLHNVESDLIAQDAKPHENSDRVHEINARAQRVRALERRGTALADRIWVCSSIDRDRLIRNGAEQERIVVVPNGIPRPESIRPRPPVVVDHSGPTLLFLGHLGYAPNIEAALALVDIIRSLWSRLPGARLILAGRNPHPDVARIAMPGKIDVIADPSSGTPLLLQSDVAVMPLKRGGGTRIKALEAMAWGLPIVATARAVEGLSLLDGVHVRIAESTPEFVDAICFLWGSEAARERQSVAAQTYAMENFGPEATRRAVHGAIRHGYETN
jgi:glycosyltransferase involved in cell wall biosynthesis